MARPSHFAALTGLRGYAALWVMISHASFTDFLHAGLGRRMEWVLADGLIRHEYLAVDLFFMLSGFVLTHVHPELDQGVTARRYSKFLLLRLARVYPLHAIALAMTLVGLCLGPRALGVNDTWQSALLHATLMASWVTPESWNVPAWSLSSEWLAYLIFPLIALSTASLSSSRARWLALSVLLAAFAFVFFGLPVRPAYASGGGAAARVLLGVGVGALVRRGVGEDSKHPGLWAAAFWVATLVALAFMSTLSGARRPDNFGAWVSMAAILATACRAGGWAMAPLTSRAAQYFGEISYGAYIFHFPVFAWVRWWAGGWLDDAARGSQTMAMVTFGLVLVLVFVVAAAAHHAVERPFRAWARARLAREPVESKGAMQAEGG